MKNTLEQLYQPVQSELDLVHTTVSRYWGETLSLIHGPSTLSPKVGGKMLRPALCLLSAGVSGATNLNDFIELAAACELLHLAALTHDDVVDKADLRRGVVSLNALWDDRTAVLSGDHLVARAVAILSSFNSVPLIMSAIDAVRRMTEGELMTLGMSAEHFTQEDCFQLAEQKTATLFAATCAAPTYLLGETYRKQLHDYGIALGIAFQIIDDILDICQDQETLGKPSCGDIVEGKRTLPILFMRESLNEEDTNRLRHMIGREISDEDRLWVASAMERTGARVKTEALARQYADQARATLESIPSSPYKDAMLGLVEFILVRGS